MAQAHESRTAAATLAKTHDKPIHFVVAGKTYEDKGEAFTALVTPTEEFVNDFVTPGKCEASGTNTIAGHSCACDATSAKQVQGRCRRDYQSQQ